MRIFIQFSIIFTEILLAGLELAAGALLLREFLRRKKQPHLFFMGVSLLIMGVANFFGYFGDFLSVRSFVGLGETLTNSYALVVQIASLFYAYVFINLYGGKWRRVLYAVTSLVALVSMFFVSVETISAFGQLMPVNSISGLFVNYGFWMVIHIGAVIATARVYHRKHKSGDKTYEPDRLLMIGSMLSVLSAATIAFLLSTTFTAGTAIAFVLLIIGVGYKLLGAMAINHGDQVVTRKPLNLISSNLITKVLVVSGLGYLVLVFVLMSTLAHFYVNDSLHDNQLRVQMTLKSTAHNFIEKKHSLLEVAALTVAQNDLRSLVSGGAVDAVGITQALSNSNTVHDYYLINHELETVFGSQEGDLFDAGAFDSEMISSTLNNNEPFIATMYSQDARIWLNIVFMPVTDGASRTIGALVVSSLIDSHDLPPCYNQMLSASGCGFVAENTEIIFSSGRAIDSITADEFRRAIGTGSMNGQGENETYQKFFVESVDITEGSGGFFYAFVSHEDADRVTSQLLSMMLLITALFFVLFSFLLVFGLRLLLLPLKMLRVGAERLAKGDYEFHLNYKSSDEIGQLANSFNSMSQTIRERNLSLTEKMHEQRDFLTHTAHEIRTPLNVFRWTLEMLRFGDVGPLNNEQMELVENMNQTNDRIRRLVNDLLEVSRMQRGRIKLEYAPIQMEDLIDEVAGDFAVRMREKEIGFYWNRPNHQLPLAFGDRVRVLQVLSNLMGNAIKFTENKGHIDIRVEQVDSHSQLSDQGDFLLVSVQDNGIGIPKKEQQQVFRRFYRGSNAIQTEVEGTGLGLYLSKQYVEMMGGHLWFDSRAGAGSTFYFTIPIHKNQ